MKLYERIENNNFDEIDKNRAIELIEGGNGHLVYNEDYFKLQKENEELNNRCRNLDKEAQAYLEELAGDNTLTRRTIKQLQEENEECKLDVQDYLKQAQENAEMYRKAQKKIQDLKAENEELKKDYYNVINKIENKIDILDIAISECIYIDDDDKAYKKAVKKDKLCLLNQKRALQELLEGGQS